MTSLGEDAAIQVPPTELVCGEPKVTTSRRNSLLNAGQIIRPVRTSCESVPRAVASVAPTISPLWEPRSLPLAVLIRPHRLKYFLARCRFFPPITIKKVEAVRMAAPRGGQRR